MMEETSSVSRAPEEKRDPTPTTSPRTSRSSSRSSGHKRQRLDPKKSVDSSADFISLDFSDSDGVAPIEEEYISAKCISKPTPQVSAESNTPRTTNGSGVEEKVDYPEGGTEEKTASKRKRKRKVKDVKEATGAVARQETNDMKEKLDHLSLKARGESSDEEDGGIKIAFTRSNNSKDGESEEEGEDKDSSIRHALKAKMQNGTQTPGEREVEKLDTEETAVVTAANPEVSSVNLSNGVVAAAGKEPEKDAEGMVVKDRKIMRKKEVKRQKDAKKAERNARKKAGKKAQINVPKGGGFKNSSDRKVDEVVEISSDDDDDGNESGLEINVDLDIDDIEGDEKAENNDECGEEREVAEATTENVGEPNEYKDDPSGSYNNNNGSDESPLVDQAIATQQRKYYSAFAPPPFRLEEARSLFAPIGKVDFTADLVQEREALATAAEALRESKRICNVCTKKGHSEDKCEELMCKHCRSWNKHFSHSCPDAERGKGDKPYVKDKWRCIPSHFHSSITQSSKYSLPIFCYSCAGNDHFGDDCPQYPPPKVLGSFSLTDINTNTYATQEWLLNFSDKLEILESEGGKSKATFGKAGTKMTVKPPPDPFRNLHNINGPLPKRPPPPTGPARGRGRDSDSYKSRAAPRDGNGGSYRQRSPARDPVFDRYRNSRDTLPPRPQTPQRPRSRSPPRHRSGGGGRGGGRSGGGGGGHTHRPDYYNRPPPREGGGNGARGGYNGGGGRAYESRFQPPLPNEPAPRRGDIIRPMPSSARNSWQKHIT